jgi:type II secretory pathway pseudopilin PulG
VLRARRGYLLAEALCALALAGALAATAATALSAAQRARYAAEVRERAGRAERESIAVLRGALEQGEVIAVRGDTAVDIDLTIVLAAACGVEALALWLPPSRVAVGSPIAVVLQSPSADDVVAIRRSATPTSAPTWEEFVVDSARTLLSAGFCDASDGWATSADASTPRWKLTLRDSLPSAVEVGATIRVARPGRFTLYHAGAGDWMLGWRRCAPDYFVCGVVQPVAGPLRTPAAGGLRIRARAAGDGWELEARGAGGTGAATATVHR